MFKGTSEVVREMAQSAVTLGVGLGVGLLALVALVLASYITFWRLRKAREARRMEVFVAKLPNMSSNTVYTIGSDASDELFSFDLS